MLSLLFSPKNVIGLVIAGVLVALSASFTLASVAATMLSMGKTSQMIVWIFPASIITILIAPTLTYTAINKGIHRTFPQTVINIIVFTAGSWLCGSLFLWTYLAISQGIYSRQSTRNYDQMVQHINQTKKQHPINLKSPAIRVNVPLNRGRTGPQITSQLQAEINGTPGEYWLEFLITTADNTTVLQKNQSISIPPEGKYFLSYPMEGAINPFVGDEVLTGNPEAVHPATFSYSFYLNSKNVPHNRIPLTEGTVTLTPQIIYF